MSEPALSPAVAAVAPVGLVGPAATPLHAVPEHPGVPRLPVAPRPAPRLELPSYDLTAALALERELGVSHVLAQILVRRGLADASSARAFLQARDSHEPSQFDGIARAVELIERHLHAGSSITVHGDYDVDGVCATAIMVRALRSLGAQVGFFLPSRLEDGYGISSETVQRLAARGTRLLVTVDCGITAVEQVSEARALGLEVVITDHHVPRVDGQLPEAPIVHPAVCSYPCPDLCGTAVAHKLAQALGASTAAEDIDLVALATVADLVPLRGENRRLVREGLAALANTAKPGLRALMRVSQADPSWLDARVLGYRLGPRINAAGRVRRADAGLELLLTGDAQRADEIAVELDEANAQRRAIEQRITWEAEAQVVEFGERSAYVLAAEDWHPGVIGIVASRVVEQHHRPAILVALDGDTGTGSGRSIAGFDLLGALHAAAEHLDRYGGHRAAAGLTVRRDRIEALRSAIETYAQAMLTEDLLAPVERADAVVSGSELGLATAEQLAALEPCGLGNPSPRLLVPGARIADVRAMGEGKHARFSVLSGGARARAVAFGCGGRPAAGIDGPLDATFLLERNVWKGAVEPRLVLRHAQPCAPRAIEVLGEPDEYLAGALVELDAVLELRGGEPELPSHAAPVLDRRGQSPLAVLADATSGGEPVLAICADVGRRLAGLGERAGGFSLISYHALECRPALAQAFGQLVALDPPASAVGARIVHGLAHDGPIHLAWGEPELRFAQQMHELEYGLRTSLVLFYRGLRHRMRVVGEELELLLRGDGPHGRPARVAGRLIRVLAELALVSLDRDLPALAVAGSAPTALERSPAYRAYQQRLKDGRTYLSSATVAGST